MKAAKIVFIVLIVFLILVSLGLFAASRFSFSAVEEPGEIETVLATKAKHVLIARASRDLPPVPPFTAGSIEQGRKYYGVECSMCHGADAHTPTDNGRWMYPRAADLRSPAVQSYSDRELFWILKHGIRLSGMPAFGKVETDEHLWNLVHFIRSLPTAGKASK